VHPIKHQILQLQDKVRCVASETFESTNEGPDVQRDKSENDANKEEKTELEVTPKEGGQAKENHRRCKKKFSHGSRLATHATTRGLSAARNPQEVTKRAPGPCDSSSPADNSHPAANSNQLVVKLENRRPLIAKHRDPHNVVTAADELILEWDRSSQHLPE
jgi:hypothetical protein